VSAIDDLLAHSVSKRGPYDLFTGERDKAVKVCVYVHMCVCVHVCIYVCACVYVYVLWYGVAVVLVHHYVMACTHTQSETRNIGPGKYELKSFLSKWSGGSHLTTTSQFRMYVYACRHTTKWHPLNVRVVSLRLLQACSLLPYVCIDVYHGKHGRFGCAPMYPDVPSERIFCDTLSQWPRLKVSVVM